MWHGINPQASRDVLEKLVDKFNRVHPDIQVEPLYVGQQDQQTAKILTAVIGNAPPDLLWYNSTITGQLVELNAIISLEQKLANSSIQAEIVPTLFSLLSYQGRIWSLPFDTNNLGVFYRPSLFKAGGVTQLPRTWTELGQVAKKLTYDSNGDGRTDRHGILLPLGKGEFTVFSWLPFLWSSGGNLVSGSAQNATKVVLRDNRAAIAALQFWQNLIQDGSALLSAPERGYEIEDLVTGRVAMQLLGPWSLAELHRSGQDFAVFPLPVNQQPATIIGGENLFLFKTKPEREQAAFKFAEYTLSEEFQTELALLTGYLPVNLKSRQSLKYQEFLHGQPQIQVFLDQEKYGRTRPVFPGYSRVSDSLGRAIESVLLNKSSPSLALEVAQQRLKASLD
jgi:multiple sugar transport system substrate-binding protein